MSNKSSFLLSLTYFVQFWPGRSGMLSVSVASIREGELAARTQKAEAPLTGVDPDQKIYRILIRNRIQVTSVFSILYNFHLQSCLFRLEHLINDNSCTFG